MEFAEEQKQVMAPSTGDGHEFRVHRSIEYTAPMRPLLD